MRPATALAGLLLLTSCSSPEDVSSGEPSPSATEPTATATAGPVHDGTDGAEIEQPPPFRVRYDEQELAIHPHTYCVVSTGCVDGISTDPPHVRSPDEIRVFVPVRSFDLRVGLREVTRDPGSDPPSTYTCGGRSFEAPVKELGDGWYAVRPHGPAGRYLVGLSADGGGDMHADLLWRTPVDGEMPAPTAGLGLAKVDGEPVVRGGPELWIDHLRSTPEDASAVVEVTADNRRSTAIEARQSRDRCLNAGSLYFNWSKAEVKAAADLGPLPFTYAATLTLDETVHTATAVYPDDEIEGFEPNVALDFDPPLPGL